MGIKAIECFGDICPIPILKIENELKTMQSGDEFMLVTDHSCTVEAIRNKYAKGNVSVSFDEVINGVWEVYIKKL